VRCEAVILEPPTGEYTVGGAGAWMHPEVKVV
jgi:hypothetical protein